MRARIRNLSLGALAGVVLVAMLGAGGFPSRPKFQAVGINTPAPAQVGGLALVPSAPGGGPTITVAATAGNAARAEFAGNGNIIGTTGMLYGQDASDIGYLWNRANQEVRFGTNNVHRGSVSAVGTFEFLSTGHFGGTGAGFFVTPHLSVQQAGATNFGVRDTTNSVEALLRAESSGVIAGAATNHSLTLRTNNTARATFAADGSVINLIGTAVQTSGVDATAASGTYTATVVGCTTSPTVVAVYRKMGNIVTLVVPPLTCTSNATSLSFSGAPALITPTTGAASTVQTAYGGINNGVTEYGPIACNMATTGAVVCARNSSQTGFTASGSKGFGNALQLTYGLL